ARPRLLARTGAPPTGGPPKPAGCAPRPMLHAPASRRPKRPTISGAPAGSGASSASPASPQAISALLLAGQRLRGAASRALLDRHALGQVPRLVHVRAAVDGHVVGEQLEGDGEEERREEVASGRHGGRVSGDGLEGA